MYDIILAILFLILNAFIFLLNKSIDHFNYLGYLIVLIWVSYAYFCNARKKNKLLIIVAILNLPIAILTDYLNQII